MNTTKTSATDSDGMLDAQVQGAMLLSIEPVEPASDRADALRDRVMAIARPAAPEPQEAIGADTHVTIRADEGEWVQRSPGVEMKILHDTPGSRSVLFRIAPGGTIPAHGHGGEEECIVLSGSIRIGDHVVRAGDFHLADTGSGHAPVTTTAGALIFVRNAREMRV